MLTGSQTTSNKIRGQKGNSPEMCIRDRPQEAPEVDIVLFLGILADPVDEGETAAVKIRRVVLGKVALATGDAPFDAAAVRLQFAHQDFKHRRLRQLVFADEGNLVVLADDEGNLVEKLHAHAGI